MLQDIYPLLLIVHLFCAIVFVGYLFFDVIIYPNVKRLGKELDNQVSNAIAKRARRIMPICVLLLLITGIMMMVNYIGGDLGYFGSRFQVLLMIKVALASIIFIFVATSLTCAFVLKCKNPLGKIIHPVAFVLSICIIILAKLMFYA